jgi:hypothetical protein
MPSTDNRAPLVRVTPFVKLTSVGRPKRTRAVAARPWKRVLDTWQRGADARVVADGTALQGDVKILPDQHALAREVKVRHFQDLHHIPSGSDDVGTKKGNVSRRHWYFVPSW